MRPGRKKLNVHTDRDSPSKLGAPSSIPSQQDAEPREETNLAWFAIYTRSRHEKVVQDNLRNKGYDSFSPFFKVRRRRGTRQVEIEVPLFSSYVFCRFDAQKRLPILKTPGVVSVVSCAGEPEPVNPSEIASLQAMMHSGRALQPWDFVQAGQRVWVRAGSLAGAEGTLVRIKNRDRLVVSVSVLQRAVAVEIDQDIVEPIY